MKLIDLSSILAALRRNAEAVTALASDVDLDQARWRPEPGKWSILEVVTHLADEEVEDFRGRVDSTLHRPEASWTPIDPEGWAVERRYNEGDLADSLARFRSARSESILWLQDLGSPDWSLAHDHPKLGPIRAGDLLTSWVAHDHIHLRQLNRLHRQFLVSSVSRFSPWYAGDW